MMQAIHRIFVVDKHRHPIDRIAKINALLSGVALYPQLYRTIVTGDVSGFSLLTYVLITANSLVWIVYAIHRRTAALLISSALNAVAGFWIAAYIIMSQA